MGDEEGAVVSVLEEAFKDADLVAPAVEGEGCALGAGEWAENCFHLVKLAGVTIECTRKPADAQGVDEAPLFVGVRIVDRQFERYRFRHSGKDAGPIPLSP